MSRTKQALIDKLGSEEALNQRMRDIASRPRKSSRGGFSDRKFAKKMGALGGKKSKRPRGRKSLQ